MDRFHAWAMASRLFRDGASVDEVLYRLREDGCSKAISVGALVDGARMPLTEAKRTVHESTIWADVRERDESIFRDDLT